MTGADCTGGAASHTLSDMAQTKRKKTTGSKKRARQTKAAQADKYNLYQQAVQDPEHEIEFFEKVYKQAFGRAPKILREDFCGTFAICCEWAKRRGREAIGVDLDPEPLDWGRANNLTALSEQQQQRVTIKQQDVRTATEPKAHILSAQNFSFWGFKDRPSLLEYFKKARANLDASGLMVMDMMGGPECLEEDHEDTRHMGSFTYVWEQARFDPITHDAKFHIHFRFKDGSELSKAFTYEWRFWTIPEVTEVLNEAGFSKVHVYWEGTDEDGEGDNNWKRATWAESEPAWIAYIVAVK
jgi:hypothetical protein